jgi:hypothetical protein
LPLPSAKPFFGMSAVGLNRTMSCELAGEQSQGERRTLAHTSD